MKIITVPHSTLRLVASPVAIVDKKLIALVEDLTQTLANHKNPQGVGLAAPQVTASKRLFATYLPEDMTQEDAPSIMKVFINPELVDHDDEVTFGPDPKSPVLEGCLSIPKLYGPVPRFKTIRLQYQRIAGDELVAVTESFADFAARVVQHELDHLNGILFTDYSLKFDLPVYQEHPKTKKLTAIDTSVLAAF